MGLPIILGGVQYSLARPPILPDVLRLRIGWWALLSSVLLRNISPLRGYARLHRSPLVRRLQTRQRQEVDSHLLQLARPKDCLLLDTLSSLFLLSANVSCTGDQRRLLHWASLQTNEPQQGDSGAGSRTYSLQGVCLCHNLCHTPPLVPPSAQKHACQYLPRSASSLGPMAVRVGVLDVRLRLLDRQLHCMLIRMLVGVGVARLLLGVRTLAWASVIMWCSSMELVVGGLMPWLAAPAPGVPLPTHRVVLKQAFLTMLLMGGRLPLGERETAKLVHHRQKASQAKTAHAAKGRCSRGCVYGRRPTSCVFSLCIPAPSSAREGQRSVPAPNSARGRSTVLSVDRK